MLAVVPVSRCIRNHAIREGRKCFVVPGSKNLTKLLMILRFFLLLALSAISAISSVTSAPAASGAGNNAEVGSPFPSRQWEPNEGGNLKGDLMGVAGDVLRIRRSSDGEVVSIPVSSLSTTDQHYLDHLLLAASHLRQQQAHERYYDIYLFGRISSVSSDHWDSSVRTGTPVEAWFRIDTSVPPIDDAQADTEATKAGYPLYLAEAPFQVSFGNYFRRGRGSQIYLYQGDPNFGDGYQFDGYYGATERDNTGLYRPTTAVRLWSRTALLSSLSHPVEEFPVRQFDRSAYISFAGYLTEEGGDRAGIQAAIESYSVRRLPAPALIGAERIWTDPTGRSFTGTLVTVDEKTVTIRRSSDARDFSLSRSGLALNDQQFLHELQDAVRRDVRVMTTDQGDWGQPSKETQTVMP